MTQVVEEHFPDRKAEIRELYLSSPEFRALCHDFGVCVQKIEQFTNSDGLSSDFTNQRREQFCELAEELEAEIVELLNAGTNTRKPRKTNHE